MAGRGYNLDCFPSDSIFNIGKRKEKSEINKLVKGLPIIPDEYKPIIKLINKKPIIPTEEELMENSRSRSAKLRIIERL